MINGGNFAVASGRSSEPREATRMPASEIAYTNTFPLESRAITLRRITGLQLQSALPSVT